MNKPLTYAVLFSVLSTFNVFGEAQSVGRVASPTYKFSLKKGTDTVCKAYLQRLNTTHFERPPYCGRPEDDHVQGFAVLHRIPLTSPEVNTLYQRVNQFYAYGKQGTEAQDTALTEAFHKRGVAGPIETRANIDRWLSDGEVLAWKYSPPLEFSGDQGFSDGLVIWEGLPLPTDGLGVCGRDLTPEVPNSDLQPQQGIFTEQGGDRIDEARTRKVFFDVTTIDRQRMHRKSPFGVSLGVFQYFGKYFWDTFIPPPESQPRRGTSAIRRLAVFEHVNEISRQICEYSMTTTWSRAVTGGEK